MHWRVLMGLGFVLACGGLFAAAPAAMAGSRFEAGDPAPVRAAVRLDFTIVIPEMLTLTIAGPTTGRPAPADAALLRWSLAVPALHPALPRPAADDAALPMATATGNAGTLAVGAPQELGSASGPDAAPAATAAAPAPGPIASHPVTEPGADQALKALQPLPRSVSLDTHPAIFLVALP